MAGIKEFVVQKAEHTMALKWILCFLLQYEYITITSSSIAGITYRDEEDLSMKYRNVQECDPFYWHPLHLPEYCAHMFEKLIRSRLGKYGPVKVLAERIDSYEETEYINPAFKDYPMYEVASHESRRIDKLYPYYSKIMKILNKEAKKAKKPSPAVIEMMPEIGPVAVYRQPFSRKSIKEIKKMSRNYAKAQKRAYKKYMEGHELYDSNIYVYDKKLNKTDTSNNNESKESNVVRKKTKNGDITVIEVSEMPPLPLYAPLR